MTRPALSDQLLTVEDAAAYIGISDGTLRNWLSAKRLTYVKIGRLTKIRRSVLDQYIADLYGVRCGP